MGLAEGGAQDGLGVNNCLIVLSVDFLGTPDSL